MLLLLQGQDSNLAGQKGISLRLPLLLVEGENLLIILSGFQTGVDRGAADAAIACGLSCYGYVPRGRLSESGPVPDKYDCIEMDSADYPARTRRNVQEAHATLIIVPTFDFSSRGTALTKETAFKLGKPFRIFTPEYGQQIVGWLEATQMCFDGHAALKINISGSRESKSPGIQETTRKIMEDVFSALGYGRQSGIRGTNS